MQKILHQALMTGCMLQHTLTQRHAHSEVSTHRLVEWHLVHQVLTLRGLATWEESLWTSTRSQISQNQNEPKHFYALSFSGKKHL